MARKSGRAVAPSSDWRVPATTWAEIINRYVIFLQVPTWRATVGGDGSEKRTCLPADDATTLGAQMLRTLDRVLPGRSRSVRNRKAQVGDLTSLFKQQGPHVPRDRRCSKKIGLHLQRAFLFNAARYSCVYCGRTAWSVYAEKTGREPRRTLRFEIDHRMTRRRLTDPHRFDPANLVVACRSCNTIKAEMLESRFRRELESLAKAVSACR